MRERIERRRRDGDLTHEEARREDLLAVLDHEKSEAHRRAKSTERKAALRAASAAQKEEDKANSATATPTEPPPKETPAPKKIRITCFRCHEVGHYRRDCPLNRADGPRNDVQRRLDASRATRTTSSNLLEAAETNPKADDRTERSRFSSSARGHKAYHSEKTRDIRLLTLRPTEGDQIRRTIEKSRRDWKDE